jgi:hypothetical protein
MSRISYEHPLNQFFLAIFCGSFFSNVAVAVMGVKASIAAQAPWDCKDETTSHLSAPRWDRVRQTMLDYAVNPLDNL